MAKKQKRYFQPNIEKEFPDFVGKQVNLILQDGQVHFVKLIRLEKDQLVGLDGTERTHYFPLNFLEEVIVEKHA